MGRKDLLDPARFLKTPTERNLRALLSHPPAAQGSCLSSCRSGVMSPFDTLGTLVPVNFTSDRGPLGDVVGET